VIDGEAVGCGGVRFLPAGIAELTRIHVTATMRRRGIGARIVQRGSATAKCLASTITHMSSTGSRNA